MSNPVTNLNGGEFLVFYAAVTLATIIVCCWLARRRDPTAGNDEKHASPELDYDEIAYLRGGEEELARAVIARLVVRGFLLVERNGAGGGILFPAESKITQAPSPPSEHTLSLLERQVYKWFRTARRAEEVFEPHSLASLVGSYAIAHCEERLHAEGMLLPDEIRSRIWRIIITGAIILAVVGIARLEVGLSREQPVGFLIALAVIGIGALLLLCGPDRRTNRGRTYTAQFEDPTTRSQIPMDAWVAVAGMGALTGTAFEDLSGMFQKSKSSSSISAGCGGGCGGCGGCG